MQEFCISHWWVICLQDYRLNQGNLLTQWGKLGIKSHIASLLFTPFSHSSFWFFFYLIQVGISFQHKTFICCHGKKNVQFINACTLISDGVRFMVFTWKHPLKIFWHDPLTQTCYYSKYFFCPKLVSRESDLPWCKNLCILII